MQAYALGLASSQIRATRRNLAAALNLAKDARSRAAVMSMMADIEGVARRADAMRLRMNAKATSTIPNVATPQMIHPSAS